MEKAKRQKVQANSQSIMIIWAKIQQNNVSFHLTGTATFLAFPRLDFKGRSLETETSSRWRELGNERLFLNKRRWPSSISIKKFFQLTETVFFFLLDFVHGDYVVRNWVIQCKAVRVICQKRVRVFHQGFQTPWNRWKLLFRGVWNPWWNTKHEFLTWLLKLVWEFSGIISEE